MFGIRIEDTAVSLVGFALFDRNAVLPEAGRSYEQPQRPTAHAPILRAAGGAVGQLADGPMCHDARAPVLLAAGGVCTDLLLAPLDSQFLLEGLAVEADYDLIADHGGRRRLCAEPDQLIHVSLVLGDVLLGELDAVARQKLCLLVAGRSPGLGVDHHVGLGHARLLSRCL